MSTIHDVAKHAGVSTATVSRVLNGNPKVDLEMRRRVLESVEELRYILNGSARSLVTKQTRQVALVISDITNPFFAEAARGAQDALDEHGYQLLLANSDDNQARELRSLRIFATTGVDGLLIAPAMPAGQGATAHRSAQRQLARDLEHFNIPVVGFGPEPVASHADLVAINEESAGLIDTSIIGVAAVSSVLSGVLVQQLSWPLWAVLLSLTGAAAVMASVNNALVVRAKVNSFVATTATSGVFLGVALALTNGQTLTITRPELQNVLLARPLGAPVAVAVMFAVYIAGYVMLNHTRLGAHLYATGENHNAARVNGVPVNRVVYTALALCTLASAFGALFATARAGSTLLFGTQFLAFDLTEIFTAVLLGGASLFGGGGKIERNLVAVLFLSILANGLQLLQAGTGVWLVLKGGSFVAAILIDVIRQRRQ